MYSAYEKLLHNHEEFKNFAREAFDGFDKDGSGFIDAQDLEQGIYQFLKEANLEFPTKEEIRAEFKITDLNHDGQISFDEYCKLLRSQEFQDSVKATSKKWLEDACATVFSEFDAKKSGKLLANKIHDASAQIAKNVDITQASKEKFDKAIKTLPEKNPRFVTLEEFTKVILLAYGEHFGEDTLLKNEKPETYGDQMAEQYTKYIEDTGLAIAFKVIFAEILSKNIAEDDAYAYTVTRLRQIGRDIAYIQSTKLKKKVYY